MAQLQIPFEVAAIKLIKHNRVKAIVAALTLEEATLVTEFEEVASTPIITIGSAAISPSPLLPQPPSIFQLNTDISIQMQCAAAIIGHFRWQKITVIYEQSNSFCADSRLAKQLSEALNPYNSVVECDLAFPSISSLLNPDVFIEEKLNMLRSKSSGIFEENIKKIPSISDYKEAFEKGEIAAAFFISPHAELFLATNRKRYVIAKPRFEVGGLAYVRFKSEFN
ncbi:Hypothetical predicted protein [Olea europaea subsp. europaea]|uniref:Receptor ligand binding region domain-containing protein n=1 Tax=Olea europaea subsp. europaea TaxID=158383 RepID=A0A8S0QWA0_OLEEU|nr:Hypothetical predicted protein [Olea europaea subsp. europaea]